MKLEDIPNLAFRQLAASLNPDLQPSSPRTFGKKEQSIVVSGGQYTKKAHREMVKEANTLAIEAFKSIGESLSDQDVISQARTEAHSRAQMGGTVKPQLFITDEGRINMLRSAPPLETLVFRGAVPGASAMLRRSPNWNSPARSRT